MWPDTEKETHKTFSAAEYKTNLEIQTRELVKELDGVKDCEVMITLECGYEYLYASDQTLDRTYDNSGIVISSNADKKYVLDGDGNPQSLQKGYRQKRNTG